MGDATMEIEHDRLTDSLSEYWSRAGLSSQDIAKDLLGRRDDKTARRILLALLDLKKLDKDEQKISDEIALRIIQCDIKARLRKEDGNSESKRLHQRRYSDQNKSSADVLSGSDNPASKADENLHSQTGDSDHACGSSLRENNTNLHAVAAKLSPLPQVINHGGTVNIHYHVLPDPEQVEGAKTSTVENSLGNRPTDLVPDRIISDPEKSLLKDSITMLFSGQNDRGLICRRLEKMAKSIAVSRWDQTQREYIPIVPLSSPPTGSTAAFSNHAISSEQPALPQCRSECPEPNSGTVNRSEDATAEDHATGITKSPPSSLVRNPPYLQPSSLSGFTTPSSPPLQQHNQVPTGRKEAVKDQTDNGSHLLMNSAKGSNLMNNNHGAEEKKTPVKVGKAITDSDSMSMDDKPTYAKSLLSATSSEVDELGPIGGQAWNHRKALTFVEDPKKPSCNTTCEEMNACQEQHKQADATHTAQAHSSTGCLMPEAIESEGRKSTASDSKNVQPAVSVSTFRASKCPASRSASPALPPTSQDREHETTESSHGTMQAVGRIMRQQTRKAASTQEQGDKPAMPKVVVDIQPHQMKPIKGHKKNSSSTDCELNKGGGKAKAQRDNLAVINQVMAQMHNAQTSGSGSKPRGPSHLSFLLGGTLEVRTCRFCKKKFTDDHNVRQPDGSSPCSHHPGILDLKDSVYTFSCCGAPPPLISGRQVLNLHSPGCVKVYHQDIKLAWDPKTSTMEEPVLFEA